MVNQLQKIAQEKIEQYQELVDSIIQLIILHEYDNIIQSDDKDSILQQIKELLPEVDSSKLNFLEMKKLLEDEVYRINAEKEKVLLQYSTINTNKK